MSSPDAPAPTQITLTCLSAWMGASRRLRASRSCGQVPFDREATIVCVMMCRRKQTSKWKASEAGGIQGLCVEMKEDLSNEDETGIVVSIYTLWRTTL